LRILIVDDNVASLQALAKVLESSGYDVVAASTGCKAIESLKMEPPPDFVLTDMVIPDLDGREIARAARSLPKAPYVALITGWTVEPDLDDPARWGVDHVFLKPLKVADLLSKLEQVHSKRRGTS
jgi:CheY-like chemotaxis protein